MLVVLNHQRLRLGLLEKLSKRIRERVVFVNASGVDDVEHSTAKVVDSREVLARHFVFGANHLLVGKMLSRYNQQLTSANPNGCRFVEVEELCRAFPEQVPLSSHRQSHLDKIKSTRRILEERLALSELKMPPQMHSVFLTSSIGIQMWDEAIQVILDYQSTEDGRISNIIDDPARNPSKGIPIHIPYFLAPPKGVLGIDHFLTSLKSIHELIYKRTVPNIVQHELPELLELAHQKYGGQSTHKLLTVDSSLLHSTERPRRPSKLQISYIDLPSSEQELPGALNQLA